MTETDTIGEDALRERLLLVSDLRERILACGYHCFDQYGTERVSVEQLCDLASVSRPTFYRYFGDKAGLITHMQELESVKIRSEVSRKINHHQDFETMLVEALFLIERATEKNQYVNGFLFSRETASRSVNMGGTNHELQKQWWGSFLERAIARGDVAADLSLDKIVSWLSASMILLMLRERGQRSATRELKDFIRRFLVRPLLP